MNLIAALALSTLVLAACQPDSERQIPKTRADQITKIATTLELPNDDGRVYVIESPADDYGLEVNACMLHIKGDASTMACTPPKMKFVDTEQK